MGGKRHARFRFATALVVLTALPSGAFAASAEKPGGPDDRHPHVLPPSLDGLHASDLSRWVAEHPAYDIVNGPSGDGVDDLFTPEISNANDPTAISVTATAAYDEDEVRAILNEIDQRPRMAPSRRRSTRPRSRRRSWRTSGSTPAPSGPRGPRARADGRD